LCAGDDEFASATHTKELVMRSHVTLAATALLATGILAPAVGSAQSAPSTEQIIKSLTFPDQPSPTNRGIRVAPPSASHGRSRAAAQSPTPAPAISLTVQFANGSAQLTPQAVQILDNLGRALSNQTLVGYRFRIEGHTDTVGSLEYNNALSDLRADAVVDYLANNFRVDRNRVETIGMGKDGLLIPTSDQTPEPRNRRVQVVNLGSQ
jgi:outer membrane protein OmpA-like peptidoglycan-associated protein